MSIIKRIPNYPPIMCNDQKLGLITQLYGANHTGVDSCVIAGLNVCAICDGTVQRVYWSDTHGKCIEYGYGNVTVRYCHMARIIVAEGQAVAKNQVVGQMGDTGSLANGMHLHTSILIGGNLVDPMPYLDGGCALPDATPAAPTPGKSIDEIAAEVRRGDWGNGAERRRRLESAGYNYDQVQAAVNGTAPAQDTTEPVQTKSVDEIAREVIAGKWGAGSDRRNRLAAAGYDYDAVQQTVNAILAGSQAAQDAQNKSVEEIAREVIRGLWGAGGVRKQRLTDAGYDYAAVQAVVNRLM